MSLQAIILQVRLFIVSIHLTRSNAIVTCAKSRELVTLSDKPALCGVSHTSSVISLTTLWLGGDSEALVTDSQNKTQKHN